MEDMSPGIDEQAAGLSSRSEMSSLSELSLLLQEHKGQDVCVLDLRGINNWTDFFIIATVASRTHIDGLERHIKEFCRENKIEIIGSSRKDADDGWRLIDLGLIIIHLMTSGVREFYELEKLWAPMESPSATPIPSA
jgi:ribosome-associated protein